MIKIKTGRNSTPVDEALYPETLAIREQLDDRSPLDQVIREGAQRMLQEAVSAEIETFIDQYRNHCDEQGRR